MLEDSTLATLTEEGGYTITISHPIVVLIIVLCAITIALVSLLIIGFFIGKRREAKRTAKLGSTIGAAVSPLMSELTSQNQVLMQALVLAQSNDKDSKLALVNLLKSAMSKDSLSVTEKVSKSIQDIDLKKKQAKEQAKADVSNIVTEISKDKSLGGIAV